ncbi:MAG TPA: PilN domain-containing protein [Candidatus Saccharimonadales bacterium]|nr:PilN domain-containing protein [Candidatus Saccharimonadales bacterium]
MADINLIPQEEQTNARVEMLLKRVQFGAISSLVVCAVLTVATLSLLVMFQSKSKTLAASVSSISSQIESYKAKEELMTVVADKTATAVQVEDARANFPKAFETLASLVPQNVYFTDIKIANGKVTFSGKAKSSADVAVLAKSLVSSSAGDILSDVSIDSLTSTEGGVYTFVISAKYAGGKATK